jgi:hypothetical protein
VFNFLGELHNDEANITAKQVLAGNLLIFIIFLSTPDDYETDIPELIWERQLDIVDTTRDLKNVLGKASVFTTTSDEYNTVFMNVRMNLSIAKGKIIQYCNLDFGHLYRFGEEDNYLLVLDPPGMGDEIVRKYLEQNFPYILSLSFAILDYYNLFISSKDQLMDIEEQMENHVQELSELNPETDIIMLAIRKDHVNELGKNIQKIRSNLQEYQKELTMNLIKIESAVLAMNIKDDKIFNVNLKNFRGCEKFSESWLPTGDTIFNRITKGVEEYNKTARPDTKRPTLYSTTSKEVDAFVTEKSPYKVISEDSTIPLEWCSSYYVVEPKPTRSLKIFKDLVTKRFLGLCITKDQPEKLIEKFNLDESSVYRINSEEGDKNIPPILSKISDVINEFLSENVHSVIYLEGLEYLIKHNDFERVLRFSNNIKESIVLNDSILITSLDNSSLDEKQLTLIKENSIDISNVDVEFEDLGKFLD